jgi:MFS transporter, DHA1 family, multidrug resistance protein
MQTRAPTPAEPATAASTADTARLIAILVAQIAIGLTLMTLCLPSMQEWAAIFAVPQSTVQLTLSAFILTFGGFQLFFGPLSDRHGRRRIALIGLMVLLVGSLLGVVAPDIHTLIVARLLQGVGGAATSVAGRAAIQDHFEGPARTRVMATMGMAMGLCPPLATLIGGQLHVRWGWRSTFMLATVLCAVLLLMAWRALPDRATPALSPTVRTSWWRAAASAYARLLGERGFVWYAMVMGFTAGAFYSFLGAAPMVLRGYGVGPAEVGVYIMVVPLAYIVGNFMTSRWAQRLGDHRLMALGHAASVGGIVTMLALAWAGWHTAWGFALPLLLFGIGHGLSVPTTLARAVGMVPALAGAAAALGGMAQQLTGALGGYVAGWLDLDQGPVPLGLLMLAATLLSSCAMVMARLRDRC